MNFDTMIYTIQYQILSAYRCEINYDPKYFT